MALLVATSLSSFAAGKMDRTIHLEVRGGSRVSNKVVSTLEQALETRLTASGCKAKIVEEETPAAVDVVVLIDHWIERGQPSESPRFDPQSGLYVTDTAYEVEAVYALEVRAPGQDEPLYDRRKVARYLAEPTRSGYFDPRTTAVDRVELQMVKHVAGATCKGLKTVAKRKRRSKR